MGRERLKKTFLQLFCAFIQQWNGFFRVNNMQIEEVQRTNYYEILDVDRNASSEEVKSAFRKLAKLYHPDNTPRNAKESEMLLKRVMASYRVLGNKRERERYDVLLRNRPVAYKEQDEKRKRRTDRMRAKAFLECLLNAQTNEALEMYERIREQGFNLEDHMSERDYLDCLFLLAEQLEEVERDKEAVDLYEELYRREKEPPRRRYFFDEIELRLQKLYSRKLPLKAGNTEEEIACYERMLEFDIDRNEEAFIWKKIAEVHLRRDEKEIAKEMLSKALDLQPALKGTAIIRCELGMEPPPKETDEMEEEEEEGILDEEE